MPRKIISYTEALEGLAAEQARARAKIQVANIVNTVHDIMEGDIGERPDAAARANVRLAAAKLLLAKALPDLSSVEHKGSVDGSITITINKLA
jgi:hypothetical protein